MGLFIEPFTSLTTSFLIVVVVIIIIGRTALFEP
jgi:hypothetical protein